MTPKILALKFNTCTKIISSIPLAKTTPGDGGGGGGGGGLSPQKTEGFTKLMQGLVQAVLLVQPWPDHFQLAWQFITEVSCTFQVHVLD